jgi:hypothetical protein
MSRVYISWWYNKRVAQHMRGSFKWTDFLSDPEARTDSPGFFHDAIHHQDQLHLAA